MIMVEIREKDDHPESSRQCSADSAKNVDSDLKMEGEPEEECRRVRKKIYGKLLEAESDAEDGELLDCEDVFAVMRKKYAY